MSVYALGSELEHALAGAALARVIRFTGAIVLELDGAPERHWCILHHRREPELVAMPEEIAPVSLGSEEMAAAAGSRISSIQTLDLERVLIARLESGGEWGRREELLLRIDLTPGYKPLSLFAAHPERLLATIGDAKARRPSSSVEVLPEKPFSILSLPERIPDELLLGHADGERAVPLPDHTRRWSRTVRTAGRLAQRIGGLDPVVAAAVSRATGGEIEAAWPVLREIGRRLSANAWDWRIYEFPEEGETCALYPIELPLDAPNERAQDFIRALERRAREAAIPSYVAHLRTRAVSRARREAKRLERLRDNISRDLEDAGRSAEYRHFANLLVTYRHLLKNGMKSITVRDFSGEREVTIPLDPARRAEANIRSYFTKAKKGEKGGLIIRNRKREVERSLADHEKLISRITRMKEPSELIPLVPREGARRAPRRESEAPERFRRFALDERHSVYVGRSDEENDILTHRFASPGDLWFHAQGVAGSHVILKGANRSTPRTVLEMAASIAAYFSKARHSATVPVIYAEKRYVRKPRKAKSGTALCTHGKTLFVSPAIPEEKKRR